MPSQKYEEQTGRQDFEDDESAFSSETDEAHEEVRVGIL